MSETVKHCASEKVAIPCSQAVPLTRGGKTPSPNAAFIAEHQQLLCMSVPQKDGMLRILDTKSGKMGEVTLEGGAVQHLVAAHGPQEHQSQFFAACDRQVECVTATKQANGDIHTSVVSCRVSEALQGVTVGATGRVLALGEQHVYECDEARGTVVGQPIALAPHATTKSTAFQYHQDSQLLIAPHKGNSLDLISMRSRQSVLNARGWEPHDAQAPTSVLFIANHTFVNEGKNEVFFVTTARNNSELRLWGFTAQGKTSLKQHIQVDVDGCTPLASSFQIHVAHSSEQWCPPCIVLTSTEKPLAVLIVLQRDAFKVQRMLTIKLEGGPSHCSVAAVRKYTESAASKSIGYALFLSTRTDGGVYRTVYYDSALEGVLSASTAKTGASDGSRWFGAASSAPSAPVAALDVARASTTAISSSLLGEKNTNTISQATASKIIRAQAAQLMDRMQSVQNDLEGLQRGAVNTMRLLQGQAHSTKATEMGNAFALRNKGRLGNGGAAGGAGGAPAEAGKLTPTEAMIMKGLTDFLNEARLKQTVQGVSSTALSKFFAEWLPTAASQAARAAGLEKIQLNASAALPSTDAARLFHNQMDRSLSAVMAVVQQSKNRVDPIAQSSSKGTEACLRSAQEYVAGIQTELGGLKADVGGLKDALAQVQVKAPALNPAEIVQKAIQHAGSGSWVEAFTVVLEAQDISAMLEFLSNELLADEKAPAAALTVPLQLNLLSQLSFNLQNQPNLIPVRVRELVKYYLVWDDKYTRMKKQAASGGKDENNLFLHVREQLTNVKENLTGLDKQYASKTKYDIRLLLLMMTKLLS